MTKGGMFYRTASVAGRGQHRKSLGTRERAEAEERGKALLAKLRAGRAGEVVPSRLTLQDLWDRYRTACPAFLARTEKQRADETARSAVLLAHFGKQCDLRELAADDITSYTTARRSGGIKVSAEWKTRPVGPRSVVADFALLNGMLNWARPVRVNGARLLEVNPLAGVARVRRDPHPRRPVATWDRFTASRRVMQQRAAATAGTPERMRWVRVELALVLAEATGRRLSAIRHLRWEDVDWERKTIRWRAEFDKQRKERALPLTDALLAELRASQRKLSGFGGWMCAAERDPERPDEPQQPLDRHAMAGLLETAEKDAGLSKLDGGLWHPYRRAWATARKHLPITDVAAAGGWANTATLLMCYQQPTNDALLAVMSEERKVRDVAVAAEK
jgi:integrase